jgi:hypothetical protein
MLLEVRGGDLRLPFAQEKLQISATKLTALKSSPISVTALARIGLALHALAGLSTHRPARTRSQSTPRSRSKTSLLSERPS